jgi:hypothetical protein
MKIKTERESGGKAAISIRSSTWLLPFVKHLDAWLVRNFRQAIGMVEEVAGRRQPFVEVIG